MSTDQPRTPEDRALARRYHFLGLPSERSNQAVSFASLRSELGDENAGALVTRIGVLAKVHNLDQLGIPLHHAVDRILQSLTADERRTISQGGVAVMQTFAEALSRLIFISPSHSRLDSPIGIPPR